MPSARAILPTSSSSPRNTAGDRRHRPPLQRAARAARRARRRHRLHRRRRADARRRRALDGAAEPHPRDRRDEPAGRRRAERHHGRSAAGGREGRPVLSAGSRPASRCRRSAATSPSAPAGRARSSTARRSATCWRSRRCCRPARSSTTGSKAVKNVVGYDLTQLLVGSEGTLAIITQDHAAPDPEAARARDAARRCLPTSAARSTR